ncbi:Spindle and kinetochore-associated protein 3 [Hirschfeldia incana]|nr:Spindle and kinetochore-associated protein 3 [Hirschfeldia incana]
MEEELKRLSKSLGGFCNHLQSSCDAFNQSLQRRPIPLDSASSTFIKSLNRRLSTAGSELNFLESMSFGTVSFEELLGHCNQIYKSNQDELLNLQDRLSDFGYVPGIEIDEAIDEESDFGEDSKHEDDDDPESPSLQRSVIKRFDEDDLLDDSPNFKSLGLSDACQTLASESKATRFASSVVKDPPYTSLEESAKSKPFDTSALHVSKTSELSNDEYGAVETGITSTPTITLIKDDYENLPSYMKALASWEDLLSAVEKFNSVLCSKKETNGSYYFRADEIPTLGLGHKEKAYTVLLTRMKRLVVETTDGVVSYRVA